MPSLGSEPLAKYIVPFDLRGGHILIRATVNDRPATLILDTGSSVATLDRDWALSLALPSLGTARGQGTGDFEVSMVRVSSIRIGELELRDETAALVPLRAVSTVHGMSVSGTLGYSLFERFVATIDYSRRELRLHEPETFEYRGTASELAIDLARRIPVVDATIKPRHASEMKVRLALDLGTATVGAMLTTPFSSAHEPELSRGDLVDAPVGQGVGGAATAVATRVEWLSLGTLRFDGPIVAMTRNGAGFLGVDWVDGTVGAPICERTTMTLDYSRKRAFFEGRSGASSVFAYDASGLALRCADDDLTTVHVAWVRPHSPADETGISAGDVLLKVDETNVTGEVLETVRKMLQTPQQTRHLTIRRTDRVFSVTMLLQASL